MSDNRTERRIVKNPNDFAWQWYASTGIPVFAEKKHIKTFANLTNQKLSQL